MYTHRERLLHNPTTPRTSLGCAVGIDQHHTTTSLFRFVPSALYQSIPGRIRDAFGQVVILEHPLVIQLLKGNDAVLIDQLAGKFVGEVLPAVGNALVNVCHDFTPSRSFGGAFLGFRKFALCFRKFSLVLAKETGIGDLLTTGEGGETLQPYINAHCPFTFRQWPGFNFTREARIPVPHPIPLNIQGLDLTFNRPVLGDS